MSEALDGISMGVSLVCCKQPSLPESLVIRTRKSWDGLAIRTSTVVSSDSSMKLHNKDPAYGRCVGGGY